MIEAPEALQRWLHVDWVREVCQRHVPECARDELQIDHCALENPRYKTYASLRSRDRATLSLVVRLCGRQIATRSPVTLIFNWRACLPGRARTVYETLRLTGDHGVRLIEEFDVLYWAGSDDPALPGLGEMLQAHTAIGQGLQFASTCKPLKIKNDAGAWQVEVVNYRPGVRCTLRYTSTHVDVQPFQIYAKMFALPVAGQSVARMQALRSAMGQEGFIIPRPLGFDPSRHVLWMEALQGQPVSARTASKEEIAKIGSGLARLHQVSLHDLSLLTASAYEAEVSKKLQKLRRFCPDQAGVLNDIEQLVSSSPSGPASSVVCTLHGDFHREQMLRTHAGIALFDYDELQYGDPLIDISNLLVALDNEADEEVLGHWQATFLEAYAQRASWSIDPYMLRKHMAIQYLTRAYRAFVQQVPDLTRRLPALLMKSHRLSRDGMADHGVTLTHGCLHG